MLLNIAESFLPLDGKMEVEKKKRGGLSPDRVLFLKAIPVASRPESAVPL